jgi:hypothetical protein
MRHLIVPALLLLTLLPARAEVYRWIDDKGVTHYGDKPPKEGVAPVQLPPLQTYAPAESRRAAPAAAATTAAPAAKPVSIRISSPAQDETIRNGGNSISLTVDVSLAEGQGLVYSLDGVAQNATPTASSAWLFENVERGEHQLGAAVVGADGRELVRAAPVTVHLKPPVVLR